MNIIPDLSGTQKARIDKAAAATLEIVDRAKQIQTLRFNGESNPAILPALIQAMAVAYAAQVVATKD